MKPQELEFLHPVSPDLVGVCICDSPGCGDIATYCKDPVSDYPLFLCTADAKRYARDVEGRTL